MLSKTMRLSQLSKLLAGEIQSDVFLRDFRRPFDEYSSAVNVVGSSVDIEVIEDQQVSVGLREVAKLCRLFASGKLNCHQLAYIADALQLSEFVDFTDEIVADIVAEFTDPEVNGPFTYERAKEIVSGIT